ncbi:MAG: DNA adenine methylase [Phycisphaerales bacterium]|nr:DNA adenine methylase [Phycisphaerales bacterium]
MIKYLGSKRALLPQIVVAIGDCLRELGLQPTHSTVLDAFSGTARVGHALKRIGCRVIANDHNAYAHALARCYVQADADDLLAPATGLVMQLNAIAGAAPQAPGASEWFARRYAHEARYIHPDNAARIARLRDEIAARDLGAELEAVMLVSLMEAADRVDSTTGLQMAYLKQWAPRALSHLNLRTPDLLPRAPAGKGMAICLNAADAVELDADVAYLDPPYNQHSYLGNYHVWETLIRWDDPEVFGIARKRIDCRERKSDFNSRRRHAPALAGLIQRVRARAIVLSFSDDGWSERTEIESLLAARGRVQSVEIDYPRYVGARIGIHNPRGESVGTVGRLRNREVIYRVVCR